MKLYLVTKHLQKMNDLERVFELDEVLDAYLQGVVDFETKDMMVRSFSEWGKYLPSEFRGIVYNLFVDDIKNVNVKPKDIHIQ